ncbi:hypothetical protein C0993_008872 [Termitomyces sp. T159_Od127]|nr:hypothetical protein C0993_008872 [Termitomyces sp. T159_Od127]
MLHTPQMCFNKLMEKSGEQAREPPGGAATPSTLFGPHTKPQRQSTQLYQIHAYIDFHALLKSHSQYEETALTLAFA